ncbi:hypothetical protein [Sulfitobacter sp. 1A15106]|uniref:hypothetical protein n=1 Tax=Sulfitobacter sp. 1A15106 TaxID=3368590 RepID=UPI0037464639
MTLIVAGHAFEIEADMLGDNSAKDSPYVEAGLFVLCDSVISTNGGGQLLDGDFRKIRRFHVSVREPQFYHDGRFHRFGPEKNAGSVYVAFAGSALSAQAVFERAAAMLSDLRVSCDRSREDGLLHYVLRLQDEPDPLSEGGGVHIWGADTFTRADLASISIHSAVVDCLKRAINETFAAKQEITTSAEQFRSWRAEFVSASWCKRTSTGRLHLYRLNEHRSAEGMHFFSTSPEEIPAGDLAVLGMRNEFETAAKTRFDRAREDRAATFDAMREFMTCSIEKHRKTGLTEIGLPIRELRLPA